MRPPKCRNGGSDAAGQGVSLIRKHSENIHSLSAGRIWDAFGSFLQYRLSAVWLLGWLCFIGKIHRLSHWWVSIGYCIKLYTIIIYYSIAITYNCKQNEHDKKILMMMMMIFVIIMIMTIIVVVIAMIMVEPEIPR